MPLDDNHADQLLAANQAANRATIVVNSRCDPSYSAEYKRFNKWVREQPELNTTAPPYLTQRNIDHYFQRVVVNRKAMRGTIRRIVSALQWYVTKKEFVHAPFNIESEAVLEALETQRINNEASGGTGRPGSDPHLGLKDIIPDSEKAKLIRYIYRNRLDWGAAAVNFTWGMNGAVRGSSNRKLKFADLNMSYGFGPVREGRQARALLLVLRKGRIHKDRHDTDKQVACWRHRDYVQCSVLATAMYVLWSLNQANPDFSHRNKRERAGWWDIPLIDWEQYSEASNSTREIFKATGVNSCKLTHHRTSALQYAGFEGLTPTQVNTMTNHLIDKQFSAYGSEAEKMVSDYRKLADICYCSGG